MESFHEAWEVICDYCKTRITDVAYKTWISRIEPIDLNFDTGEAILLTPNEFHRQTLTRCYLTLLEEAFEAVFGSSIKIKLTVPDEVETGSDIKEEAESPDSDYEYTFETFIVGSSNKFAHAASLAVAANPAGAYNPLFIYGHSGLGKTHLLYAIGNDIKKNHSNINILYVKGDDFANELIESIQMAKTKEFRQKYRNADVLLVDDVQFIGGKESTQEEFFHTFNTLYESKKQIIISSDKPPKEIETLEERLRSRFEWGLTVDIQSPDYETRMAILRKKEEMEGYNIDNEVIKYIATNIKSNIRELEGALTKIVALSRLNKCDITLGLAEEALKDIISPNAQREVTPNLIIQVVSDHFGITPLDISSQKRTKEIVYPRQIVMYLCRNMTETPLQSIGRILGGRDHTTIIHGSEKIAADMNKDDNLKNTIEILKKKINPQ